jgi:hypothetical protein
MEVASAAAAVCSIHLRQYAASGISAVRLTPTYSGQTQLSVSLDGAAEPHSHTKLLPAKEKWKQGGDA